MKLKIFIVIFTLLFSSILFPAFEFEFSPRFGVNSSFTDLTKDVYEPRVGIDFQLGYEFPINKGLFKGFGLLFDFGFDVNMLSIRETNEKYKINQMDAVGLYTGLALKLVLNENKYSSINTAVGLASGVKFLPIIEGFKIKPNKVPFYPYVRLFVEDRIFISEKTALIVGVDIFYEYMFFDKSDRNRLFAGYNINQHHSIGANIYIGARFGKR